MLGDELGPALRLGPALDGEAGVDTQGVGGRTHESLQSWRTAAAARVCSYHSRRPASRSEPADGSYRRAAASTEATVASASSRKARRPRGQERRARCGRVRTQREHGAAEHVGLDLGEHRQPSAAAGHPQLLHGRAGRLELVQCAADAERDPLEHRVGERRPVMTQREPDERASKRGVVALAVAEVRQEERRHVARVGPRAAQAPQQPLGICCQRGMPRVPEPAHRPVDRSPARVDPELGREAIGDHVAVVGHPDVGERLGDRGVEARRRPGHLAGGPRVDHAGAERHALAVAGPDHDGDAGGQTRLGSRGGGQLRRRRPCRQRLGEEARVDIEPGEEIVRPAPLPQIEEQRRIGVRLIGGGAPREAPQDDVTGLQELPCRRVHLRLVAAQPQQLGADVERLSDVAGARMHRLDANLIAHLGCLGDGAVVAVEHARPDRPAVGPHRYDGRALAGQADARDALRPAELARKAVKRRDGVLGPVTGILLGPARMRRVRPVRPPHLRDHRSGEVDGHRPGAGRADVDGDEQGAAGAHPRTSWCARTLSPSSTISAPFSAPVP